MALELSVKLEGITRAVAKNDNLAALIANRKIFSTAVKLHACYNILFIYGRRVFAKNLREFPLH